MAAQKGRDLLLKVKVSAAYVTVGSFRSNDLTINNGEVDITDKDSAGWRELLAGGAVRTIAASGNGLFKASTQEKALVTAAMSGAFLDCQIVVPALGTFEGNFNLGTYTASGAHDGAVEASISLASAEEITFTPDA